MFEIEEVGNPDLDDQVPIKKKKSSSSGDLTRRLTSPYGSSNPYVMSGSSSLPLMTYGLLEPYVMSGSEELRGAVGLYCSDQAAAEATYGEIGTWNTGQVTSMRRLFGPSWAGGVCSTYATFDADISGWDGKFGMEEERERPFNESPSADISLNSSARSLWSYRHEFHVRRCHLI